jgi:hypothetical protein
MAWYNSGNWDSLTQSEWANALTELAYAINEREGLFGHSLTEWTNGDITSPLYPWHHPTATELRSSGLPIASTMGTWMMLMRDRIETWGTAYNSPESWRASICTADATPHTTNASIIGSGSYGSSWDPPRDSRLHPRNDPDPWYQIKTILDANQKAWFVLGPTAFESYYKRAEDWDWVLFTWTRYRGIWVEPTGATDSIKACRWYRDTSGFSDLLELQFRAKAQVGTSNVSGTHLSTRYPGYKRCDSGFNRAFEVDINGTSLSIAPGTNTTDLIDAGTSWPTSFGPVATYEVEVTADDQPDPFGGSGDIYAYWIPGTLSTSESDPYGVIAVVYTDISGELTYG